MRRRYFKFIILMCMCLALASSLASCAVYPTKADDGAEWDKSWEMMGQVMGIETPGDGLELLENDSVLTGQDTYYATWAVGEPTTFVNDEGKDTDLYAAQLYLIVFGCKDEESAAAAVKEWTETEEATYSVLQHYGEVCNGQEYDFLVYDVASETNPFHRGATAFTTYGEYAISAEVTCLEDFEGDPAAMLKNFLEGCHYSSELMK